MSSEFNLYQFVIFDHESVGHPGEHRYSVELFRDLVVAPSLEILKHKIDDNHRSNDPAAEFLVDDLAYLLRQTLAGYLLTVQSMWERGLRKILIGREQRLYEGRGVIALQKANWTGDSNLQSHFERLLKIPLTAFDSYADLNLLQNLGNAVRHGDGASAQRLYKLAPALWFDWVTSRNSLTEGKIFTAVPIDVPKSPPFEKINFCEDLLMQMIQSVSDFWEDVEYIRCNSFHSKSDSVMRMLEAWPEIRHQRKKNRRWFPNPM